MEDRVSGDAFFINEYFDLCFTQLNSYFSLAGTGFHTRFNASFARSLTAPRAIIGILSAALCGFLPLASKLWLKSVLDIF